MDVQGISKLSITTNTVVADLPNEILEKAFMRLRGAALKNVRLTSKHWNELSAGLMFKRIYFSPAKTVIENFTLITNNPLLCTNITEVVYDARVFSIGDTSPQSIKKKREILIDFFQEDEEDLLHVPVSLSTSQLQEATENLQHLYQEQQDTLENAHDTQALIAGLRNLPRLEDLTIPGMVHCRDTIADQYPHREYVTKLNKLISNAILPKGDVLRLKPFCGSGIHKAWQETHWSPQGIYHLFHVSGLGQEVFAAVETNSGFL